MPSVALRSQQNACTVETIVNPLPPLLHTPAGYALIEIQGTIHAPTSDSTGEDNITPNATEVGRLEFPLYDSNNPGEGAWMKKVYLYVGKYQRLSGQVKKLPKAMLIVMKDDKQQPSETEVEEIEQERLDILAVIKYKIIFANRPEPVGS